MPARLVQTVWRAFRLPASAESRPPKFFMVPRNSLTDTAPLQFLLEI
jgi:hypothetical protein